jgi:hypothetical protein
MHLLRSVNLQSTDTLVSFDVVSLFTSVPVEEALQVISGKLQKDETLASRFSLQVDALMELLKVCLKTTYFQVHNRFFQQKDGMAMGNSLSPVVCNVYMEHFEKLALDAAPYKPSLWLQYVDDTFVIWPHGTNQLQEFLDHLNGVRPSMQFTMEIESNNSIPFLDILVIRKDSMLTTTVYRKPTHTGRYLNFDSNHPGWLPYVRD